MCWRSWTYVMCLHPFAWTNVFSAQNMCFAFWARVDTKFLNLSHHFLSMDGWPGDATFFPVGPTFEDHPHVFSQKRSSPLESIFDTCASASSGHLFGWWSCTYVVVNFFKDKCMFSQKSCVLHCGRALTQNYWICPIMSYLWMVGLVMRLFSCGANLWRSSACIQPKKVQPLGIYFWHLRLGLFKSPFLVGEAEHVWLKTFSRTNVCSAKNQCFAFWARVDTKLLNLSHHFLSMDGWPVMRLFSCGANLWRSSACIQPKKVQPLGIYFWHLRLGLFKSPFLVGEAEHMWLQPFARTNVFSAKNICFAFWARVQDKCTPLQGQIYLWNLFLMSNLRTFSIIIIIAPFSQI